MTDLLGTLFIVFGIPVAVLFGAATVAGKTRWVAICGLMSYIGLGIGLILLVVLTPDEPPARKITSGTERFCRHCGTVMHIGDRCRTCGSAWTPSHRAPIEVLADAANLLLSLPGRTTVSDRTRLVDGLSREIAALASEMTRPVYAEMPSPAAPAVDTHPTPVAEPARAEAVTEPGPVTAQAPVAEVPSRPTSPPLPSSPPIPSFRPPPPVAPVLASATAAAAAAASTPRVATPHFEAPPPREPGESVRAWAAHRQADLLLYLGAFLLSIAALTFVNYQGEALSDTARVMLLGSYTFAFLALGFFVRRWDRVKEAGPVFVGLGAVLTPLWLLLLYVQVLEDREVGRSLSLFLGSSLTCGLYSLLAWRGFGRLYAIPASIAGLIAWGALGSTLELPNTWQGAWFMGAAVVAVAAARERLTNEATHLVYFFGQVIAGVAIVFAAGTALADVPDGEVQLPVTLALAAVGAAWLASRHRVTHAFGVLPPLVVAAGWSTAWAIEWQGPGRVEWLGVTIAIMVYGYAVLREFRREQSSYWQMAEILTSIFALVAAHIALTSGDQHAGQLSVTFGLIAVATAWESLRRQDTVAIGALPFLVMGTAFALEDAFDVPVEHWAWAPLGIALLMLGTERLWGRSETAARSYPPLALLFSLFPVLLVQELREIDREAYSAVTLGIAGATWVGASIRALRPWPWVQALTARDPDAPRYGPGVIAGVGASLLYAALWLALEGAEVARNDAMLALAAVAAGSWFVAAGTTRKWPVFDPGFIVPGVLVMVITTLQVSPSFDRLSIAFAAAMMAASLAAFPPRVFWRWTGAGVALLVAWSVMGARVEEMNTWLGTLALAMSWAAVAWDGYVNKRQSSFSVLPVLLVLVLMSAIDSTDAGTIHLAWPAVSVSLALAATQPLWARDLNWKAVGWTNALGLALVPIAFLDQYQDRPSLGAVAFAGAAASWVLAGYFERARETPVRPPVNESAAWSVAVLLGFFSVAFAGESQDLGEGAYCVLFSTIMAIAFLAIAGSGKQVQRLLIPGLLAAAIGTYFALTSTQSDGQAATVLALAAAGSLATTYSLRAWWPTAVSTVFGAISIAVALESIDAASWWPGVVYTAVAAGAAIGLTHWRTYKPTQSAVFSVVLPLAWYAFAVAAASAAVSQREEVLLAGDYLPRTVEWAAASLVLLAGGVGVALEGLRIRRPAVVIGGGLLGAAAIEMGIAMADPITVQAYTTPAGLALVAAGFFMKRSSPLFGRHMSVHEGLMTLGVMLVVLPGASDALTRPDIGWSLLLIAEGIVFLAVGLALAQRWLVVGGVVTLVGVAVRFYTSGTTQPPYWVTLGLVGTTLLALGVLLLGARDWWDRRKDQLIHWWFGDDVGPLDTGGVARP